jgi:hypothetical protein
MEAENTAVPLRPEEVPKDLICAICMGLPVEAAVTIPCDHLFCKKCILLAISHSQDRRSCPICRTKIYRRKLLGFVPSATEAYWAVYGEAFR